MTKHYVLNVDPSAEYDWDRCTLRDPITAERPELAQIVADALGRQAGSYLISVDIKVTVLEHAPVSPSKAVPLNKPEVAPHSQPKEKVA